MHLYTSNFSPKGNNTAYLKTFITCSLLPVFPHPPPPLSLLYSGFSNNKLRDCLQNSTCDFRIPHSSAWCSGDGEDQHVSSKHSAGCHRALHGALGF